MNLKKIKLIATIGIFILAFPLHFTYNIFPNTITAIFTPINESIWEHMKMIFTAHIIYSMIDYLLIKHYNIKINNFKYNVFFTSLISIPIYLILFTPLFIIIGENLLISIGLMLITCIITQIISYKILTYQKFKYLNTIALPLIIISYLLFLYLTYFPPHNFLFFDILNNIYGPN